MLPRTRWVVAAVLGLVVAAGTLRAAETNYGLKSGTPDLQSAGPLAFGPDGILFVGDVRGAAVFAIDTGDKPASPASGGIKVEKIDEKIASLLGTTPKEIMINAVTVNPASGKGYLSVARGKTVDAPGVLVRVDQTGKVEEVPLKDVKFAKAQLTGAATGAQQRREAITHLEYAKGRVIVAGLSNEEFSSRLRTIPFPFAETDKGTGVEIFHGSHGRLETKSPIRTFTLFDVGGETNLLAAYTCTPLVKVPLSELKPGAQVKGVTIAELGNRNRPLDMVVYQKDGKDYILMANNARGVMKITTDNIDKVQPITERIPDKAGLKYETVAGLKGVEHLAKLDKDHVLVLARAGGGLNLDTIDLP